MATLDALKWALRQKADAVSPSARRPLSDIQYGDGFEILMRGSGSTIYQDFIIPQLSLLLAPLFQSRTRVSILEIGPGPESVLGHLPDHMRHKVREYAAFEPNRPFAGMLEERLQPPSGTESPFPRLDRPPDIRRAPFAPRVDAGRYDVVLFCHSMYGMVPRRAFVESALGMLAEEPRGGMVVLFHRDGNLDLDGLVCHRTASFPAGAVRVADDDETLDRFASFVAGFVMQDADAEVDEMVRSEWREVCRALGRHEQDDDAGDFLWFSSPNIMAAFTKNATALPELTARVPLVEGPVTIKNREARLHRAASIVRPTEIQQVQDCVRWALKNGVGLTVLGGGHSGQCLWPNVVSVDMGAFNQIHIIETSGDGGGDGLNHSPLVVAGAGCKTGDIIRETMAAGWTVPLGARPSVGAGLWLQGGIGHLSRLHGLACDAIVGAVLVDVESGRVLVVGDVPGQHVPAGAVRPDHEADLLWAVRGAGTNFGIVVGVVFGARPALVHSARNWIFPLDGDAEAQRRLGDIDGVVASSELPRNCSVDAYLYWSDDKLCLGVTMYESSSTPANTESTDYGLAYAAVSAVLGPSDNVETVDGIGLFETEMYMSGMHGGHGGGKTSSFKRCIFLRGIGAASVVDIMITAIRTRPSPLCYLHLLNSGGAVSDVAADSTAFGCRDWSFACVITGVWPRGQDGTEIARAAVQWVYDVAGNLLPLSRGVYGADLGPDPRDNALAARAFGPNWSRLGRLKRKLDPHHVLAYACPLLRTSIGPNLVVLVTGESCAGKDYCAEVWASRLIDTCSRERLAARVASISDATKRAYAAASGADPDRLLRDRVYKEQHRPALTAFFQSQLKDRPRLREENFLEVIHGAADVDVLLITGMREDAPVATLSHLVPDIRLIEVRVWASEEVRRARQGGRAGPSDGNTGGKHLDKGPGDDGGEHFRPPGSCPDLGFNNDTAGDEAAKKFVDDHLLLFLHDDLRRLGNMMRAVPGFPRRNITFQHVLGISQQPGGLALCTSLLQTHLGRDWSRVGAVVCCEAGGFVYASALALSVNVPLALIREAGKLPPPIVTVPKPQSHISSASSGHPAGVMIGMERDVVPKGMSVVVVDDVLATGETLCAVLQLLEKAGIFITDISIIVIVEFPVHRGRELLHRRGFGGVNIRSLLVYGDA